MRRTASEKMEIIRLVEQTELSARATLRQLGIPRSTFYGWYQRYLDLGFSEAVRLAGRTEHLRAVPP